MSDHCVTCGDDGVPMRVLSMDGHTAVCATEDGCEAEVEVSLVDAEPGDSVLVHAGVALVRL